MRILFWKACAHLVFAVPPPQLRPGHGLHVANDGRPLNDGREQAGHGTEAESADALLEVPAQD